MKDHPEGPPRGVRCEGNEQPQLEGPLRLLEDFGARAMRDLSIKVIFEDLRMLQAYRALEVNIVIHLLALRVWLLSRSNKIETFVHAWA